MARKRLFDQPRHQPQRISVSEKQIMLPARSHGACGVAVCLQSAMAAGGAEANYADLMGLLGAAFMLRVDADFELAAGVEGRWERAVETLKEFGFAGARLIDGVPSPDDMHEEIAAGRPVAVLRWGGLQADWSLVSAVSESGDIWWGHEFCANPIEVKGPPSCRLALLLGGREGVGEVAAARRAGVRRAAHMESMDDNPIDAYRKWADIMRGGDVFPSGATGDEKIMRQELLANALLDARAAGCRFLISAADDFEEAAGEEVLRAADEFGRVVDMLEARRPSLFSPETAVLLRERRTREEWAAMLERAADVEAGALEILKHIDHVGYW